MNFTADLIDKGDLTWLIHKEVIKILTVTVNGKVDANLEKQIPDHRYEQGSFISEMEWAPLSSYFGTLMTQLESQWFLLQAVFLYDTDLVVTIC